MLKCNTHFSDIFFILHGSFSIVSNPSSLFYGYGKLIRDIYIYIYMYVCMYMYGERERG